MPQGGSNGTGGGAGTGSNPPGGNGGGGSNSNPPAPKTDFDRLTFIKAVLNKMGITPSTGAINAMLAWAASENTAAAFNPFAIDGAYSAVYNTAGNVPPPGGSPFRDPSTGDIVNGSKDPVWNFASFNQAVEITATVISQRFAGIASALQNGSPALILQEINASGWGSGPTMSELGSSPEQGLGNGNGFFPSGYSGDPGKGLGGAGNGPGGGPSSTSGGGIGYKPDSYLQILQSWGLPITPAIHAFAVWAAGVANGSSSSGGLTLGSGANAVTLGGGSSTAKGLTMSEFEYLASQQSWFKDYFPGIFGKNGGMLMSPAVYNDRYKQYQGIATQFGFTLNRQQFGYALKKNIDSNAFASRLNAIRTVESNKQDFHQFVETLKERGMLPKGGIKKADLYKFVEGKGPHQWNAVWQEAWLRAEAANAGLVVGKNIQRGLILNLEKTVPDLAHLAFNGDATTIYSNFQKLANDLKTTVPASRLFADHGLTASDMAQLEFGGPKQAQIALVAQRALASYKAQFGNQAQAELGTLGQRVGAGQVKTAVTNPFETP